MVFPWLRTSCETPSSARGLIPVKSKMSFFCGLPEGATGHNIARNAALEAGFGVGTPGVTINRYCGSGITAASMAANRIATGEADILQPRPTRAACRGYRFCQFMVRSQGLILRSQSCEG